MEVNDYNNFVVQKSWLKSNIQLLNFLTIDRSNVNEKFSGLQVNEACSWYLSDGSVILALQVSWEYAIAEKRSPKIKKEVFI